VTTTVPRILIVGGGYAGFYTAWKLEKELRRGEAEVTVVDPLPYMTYQPFLPERSTRGTRSSPCARTLIPRRSSPPR
jgi:NADH dehydrogenase